MLAHTAPIGEPLATPKGHLVHVLGRGRYNPRLATVELVETGDRVVVEVLATGKRIGMAPSSELFPMGPSPEEMARKSRLDRLGQIERELDALRVRAQAIEIERHALLTERRRLERTGQDV